MPLYHNNYYYEWIKVLVVAVLTYTCDHICINQPYGTKVEFSVWAKINITISIIPSIHFESTRESPIRNLRSFKINAVLMSNNVIWLVYANNNGHICILQAFTLLALKMLKVLRVHQNTAVITTQNTGQKLSIIFTKSYCLREQKGCCRE